MWLQTWDRWHEDVEREDVHFARAPEYHGVPGDDGEGLKPYQAAVRTAEETAPLLDEVRPDAMVVDILTVGGALAAEVAGCRWATLVPHVLPTPEPGFAPYSSGARLPRTRFGRDLWIALDPVVRRGAERGRDELNGARERLGLPALKHLHGGVSRELALVATFPQLEYPRSSWHPSMRVTGPLMWERPFGEVETPAGDAPLVLIAPSTSQDPEQRMLAAALEGLANAPVRVLATTNRRAPAEPIAVPANARLVDWLSYERSMPGCAAVVCHAGHGTVVRALASGVPVVACPATGDMFENAQRVAWAGAGVSLPRRLTTPRGIALAVQKVLSDSSYARRAGELREWANRHDGRELAADALEELARS